LPSSQHPSKQEEIPEWLHTGGDADVMLIEIFLNILLLRLFGVEVSNKALKASIMISLVVLIVLMVFIVAGKKELQRN
jgi:uncharacterized PurR-regulated membrane protein YhhQ (DUF165 family)